MGFIESALSNGTEITFTLLFVGMLIYVMKNNETREAKYQETVQILSNALTGYEDLKHRIEEIKDAIERKG